jgi:catechol 2,3-dioxygenase-like lactoylglutathione lyase family enzyme
MSQHYTQSFCVIGVGDIAKAERFYRETLGLNNVGEQWPGSQLFELGGGKSFILYNDKNHRAGTGAVLTFHVSDIDAAVDQLIAAGVTLDTEDAAGPTDAKGILRQRTNGNGPDVALFKDPGGNIISFLQLP